jgi:hypothetical protein
MCDAGPDLAFELLLAKVKNCAPMKLQYILKKKKSIWSFLHFLLNAQKAVSNYWQGMRGTCLGPTDFRGPKFSSSSDIIQNQRPPVIYNVHFLICYTN